jgi:hypothetical protein
MQEANLKLEKRLLKEDDVAATSAANVNSAVKGLTPQEKQEVTKFLKGLVMNNGRRGFPWLLNSKSQYATSTYSPLVLTKSDVNTDNIMFPSRMEFEYGKPLVYSLYPNSTANINPITVQNYTPTFAMRKLYKGIFVEIVGNGYQPTTETILLSGNVDSILAKLYELSEFAKRKNN